MQEFKIKGLVSLWKHSIDEMLQKNNYEFARETLEGIRNTIDITGKVTTGQVQAVRNIREGGKSDAGTEKNNSYRKKLLDPKWQKKRLEILERDGWKCLSCKSEDKTLHVHHKAYEYGRDPWDYPNANLITLCKDCHSKAHYVEGMVKKIANCLKEAEPKARDWFISLLLVCWQQGITGYMPIRKMNPQTGEWIDPITGKARPLIEYVMVHKNISREKAENFVREEVLNED